MYTQSALLPGAGLPPGAVCRLGPFAAWGRLPPEATTPPGTCPAEPLRTGEDNQYV
jgi:hypothetical protein